MHSLLNSLKSTSLLFPLLFLLTNASQIKPREMYTTSPNLLVCDTRTLPNINPLSDSKWNITSTCLSKYDTNCVNNPAHPSPILDVGSLSPDQLQLSKYSLCDQGGFSKILPAVTPAICACACKCTNPETDGNPPQADLQVEQEEEEACVAEGLDQSLCTGAVQSMSVSSTASVMTSTVSNYTMMATGSAPALSTTSVRGLGPQEGFQRKARV